jgi:hypothetical protein
MNIIYVIVNYSYVVRIYRHSYDTDNIMTYINSLNILQHIQEYININRTIHAM